MIMAIYDILLHLCLIFLLPYLYYKRITKGKYKSGIAERFGIFEKGRFAALKGSANVVWFHAVSVGETKAIIPLVKKFKKQNLECRVVFSTITPTGQKVAREEGKDLIDVFIYFPLDFAWVVSKVLDFIMPSIFVVVEKEVWPNTVYLLNERRIPTLVANGAISDNSFKNYQKLSVIFRPIFEKMTYFCAQTEQYGKKALALGLKEESLVVTGNIKFDMSPSQLGSDEKKELKAKLGFSDSDVIFTAGSTHKGEEDKILSVFGRLKKDFPELKLIIAPRHPERFKEVEGYIKASGFGYKTRSLEEEGSKDIVLLDTLGELVKIYDLSTVCFVGGTLVDIGGHNLMEPSYFGKPVLYGTYLKSYLYMAEMLESENASIRVEGQRGLEEALRELLKDRSKIGDMGEAGRKVVMSNKGATDKTIELMETLLI